MSAARKRRQAKPVERAWNVIPFPKGDDRNAALTTPEKLRLEYRRSRDALFVLHCRVHDAGHNKGALSAHLKTARDCLDFAMQEMEKAGIIAPGTWRNPPTTDR